VKETAGPTNQLQVATRSPAVQVSGGGMETTSLEAAGTLLLGRIFSILAASDLILFGESSTHAYMKSVEFFFAKEHYGSKLQDQMISCYCYQELEKLYLKIFFF
jgi:hypothetical protein